MADVTVTAANVRLCRLASSFIAGVSVSAMTRLARPSSRRVAFMELSNPRVSAVTLYARVAIAMR